MRVGRGTSRQATSSLRETPRFPERVPRAAAGEISSVENPKYEDSDAQRFICAGYRGG
ncbi:uncharacterized protein LOC144157725 isoform X2 [Haemaphysalis longicornis]